MDQDVKTYGEMMEGGEHSGEKLFRKAQVQSLL